MKFDRFLPDYGILPSAYFKKNAITNPIELFWSDDLLSLLRLCGAEEERVGKRASDFDRFLSLCRALPLLEGHHTRAWIISVLKEHFGLQELPTEETATDIWRTLCESLMVDFVSPKDLIGGAWLCDQLTVPNALPENITPVLNANLLLQTNAKTATVWSAEIESTIAHFAANRCQKIVLHLSNGFDFATPSLYHVDRALSLTKRDREATNLLTCQLMRELCMVAQRHDLLLVIVCEDNPGALANLLEYAEGSVGLPRLCWSIREAREAYALIDFTAKAHKNEIFAAFPYESVITEREFSSAIESWQMRYPIGRLCFVTARDLRQTPYAQAHIADILKKGKTKI